LATNFVAFNGDAVCKLATEILALAEKQGTTAPLMIGHRIMGSSLLMTGDIAEGRAHYDQALAFYSPAKHRPLATRFGQDVRVAILSFRPLALWLLGYSKAALADHEQALRDAREIGHAATLMYAMSNAAMTNIFCGNFATATALTNELVALADEKGASFWKAYGMMHQGCVSALTGKAPKADRMFTSGFNALRATGTTLYMPWYLSLLAVAYAELGRNNDAWRCLGEATATMETGGERWFEAELHRTAGEIELMDPERGAAKAEACFERALAVARKQRAKSWELRSAMSMARLRRRQGKRNEARELLAPIYGWFTEGFETLDLKQAKALLDELA